MIKTKLKTLAEYSQGQFYGKDAEKELEIKGITTDSRKAADGVLFACIKGERVDGHDFIKKASEAGAAAVICEKAPDTDIPYILVDSTVKALQDIAREMLKKADIPVVAIGGSVGKTSTKEMVASVLSTKFNILKTEGNFNNELGLPLTIFELKEEHEAAVLELGISDFGEMHLLASIARPDICILTNIGDCHLEQLHDRDGVLKAKTEMFDFLEEDGAIILNGDDERLRRVRPVNGVEPFFFGFNEDNELRAVNIKKNGPLGSDYTIETKDLSFDVTIHMPGDHMILNSLAAAAAGLKMGLTPEMIRQGIADYVSIDGRFNVIRSGKYTVIDDCYNANPMSMKASLSALAGMPGRKAALLGDMGELGRDEEQLHFGVGEYAAALDIDVICCAGPLSRNIVNGLKENGSSSEIHYFSGKEELISALPQILKDNDTVLVKASHFMEFQDIVKSLTAN